MAKNKEPITLTLWEAVNLYGFRQVKMPRYVSRGYCNWCGRKIKDRAWKLYCGKNCYKAVKDIFAKASKGEYGNQILWRDNCSCVDCSEFLGVENKHGVYIPYSTRATIHHVRPIEQGGDDKPINLVTLCEHCYEKRLEKLENN